MSDQQVYFISWVLFVIAWWDLVPVVLGFPDNMFESEEDLW